MIRTGRSEAAKLKTAGKAELLAVWRANIGKPPPFATSRELLAMALAWHLQERKYGGFNPLVRRKLEALAKAYRRGQLPAALLLASSFRPGTVIIKLWRRRRHTVIALEHGFRYQGKIYHSLSPIARAITGTRCNGSAFFGLRTGEGSAPDEGQRQRQAKQQLAALRHRTAVHDEAIGPGEHQAIGERELTNSLKRVLAPGRRQLETRERFDAVGALLTGMIFDDAGNQMIPIRADKGARRYRYYVSRPPKEGARSLYRLPASELEKLVIDKTLEALEADVRTSAFAMKLAGHGEIARRQFLRGIIRRVEVGQSLIRLHLDGAGCWLFAQPGPVVTADLLRPMPIAVEIPLSIEEPLPADGLPPELVDPHPALIKALVRGYLWRTELMSGRTKTVGRLITKVRFPRNYVLRILRLGFLAP